MKVIERINKQIKIACSESRDCLSNFGLNQENFENTLYIATNFYGHFVEQTTKKL